jgi:hypothetical protein
MSAKGFDFRMADARRCLNQRVEAAPVGHTVDATRSSHRLRVCPERRSLSAPRAVMRGSWLPASLSVWRLRCALSSLPR